MTFGCEVQLLAWSETSQGGARITLQLADAEDLSFFQALTMKKGRGKEAIAGQRLMAGFAEIGDDEKPVKHEPTERNLAIEAETREISALAGNVKMRSSTSRFPDGLCGLAVKWLADEHFLRWIETCYPSVWDALQGDSEARAKYIICTTCGIESRSELNTNGVAAETFRSEFLLPYSEQRRKDGIA